jgi:nicotinamide mononucleotide transporter
MGNVGQFLIEMAGSNPVEIAAVLLGIVNISLLVMRSVWNFPFGIVMASLYAAIFFDAKLYGNSVLQLFFINMQLYGWWYWLRWRDAEGLVIVERLSARGAAIYGAAAVAGVAAIGTAMGRFTDASDPYWDVAIAVLSVIAQILLARRRLENWIVWIIVDVLAIGLFWKQGLHPTAALYAVFLVLATAGFFAWARARRSGVVAA